MYLDARPIILVVGVLVAILGATMYVPALVDFANDNSDWQVFAFSGSFCLVIGGGMFLATRGTISGLTTRQAFLMTVLVWVALAAFGALPFYWSGLVPHYTDAFFESMSGITTTGATIMIGLDIMPPGILLWRGILQWIGGLGIIVMAISVLPMLQIGGMQLFKAEAFETTDKILPRATQISGSITVIFMSITLLCGLAYLAAGMNILDASVHAMTTVATGGYSTRDLSIGFFDSLAVDMTATIFMIIGSLPFILYVQALAGDFMPTFRDSQVRAFFGILLVAIVIGVIIQETSQVNMGGQAWRHAVVNVTSILTGTGYATTAYDKWGTASMALFFFVTFIGGCAGSTSCGIKIFRLQILLSTVRQHLARVLYPHGVIVQRYNGKAVDDGVVSAVIVFFFLYVLSFAVSAIMLSLTGLDALTAMSGAGTAIANVGPGVGPKIGPSATFEGLNLTAKWILSITMLVGRLEIMAVLVLLSPRCWRV